MLFGVSVSIKRCVKSEDLHPPIRYDQMPSLLREDRRHGN